MRDIIKNLFKMMFLKGGPEELPYSKVMLYLLSIVMLTTELIGNRLVANVAIQHARFQTDLNAFTVFDFLLVGLLKLLLLLGFVYGLLVYYKKKERFVQVAQAMLGISILFSLFFIANVYLMYFVGFAIFLFFVLIYWKFLVVTIIFARGIDRTLLKAGLYAFLYMILRELSKIVFRFLI